MPSSIDHSKEKTVSGVDIPPPPHPPPPRSPPRDRSWPGPADTHSLLFQSSQPLTASSPCPPASTIKTAPASPAFFSLNPFDVIPNVNKDITDSLFNDFSAGSTPLVPRTLSDDSSRRSSSRKTDGTPKTTSRADSNLFDSKPEVPVFKRSASSLDSLSFEGIITDSPPMGGSTKTTGNTPSGAHSKKIEFIEASAPRKDGTLEVLPGSQPLIPTGGKLKRSTTPRTQPRDDNAVDLSQPTGEPKKQNSKTLRDDEALLTAEECTPKASGATTVTIIPDFSDFPAVVDFPFAAFPSNEPQVIEKTRTPSSNSVSEQERQKKKSAKKGGTVSPQPDVRLLQSDETHFLASSVPLMRFQESLPDNGQDFMQQRHNSPSMGPFSPNGYIATVQSPYLHATGEEEAVGEDISDSDMIGPRRRVKVLEICSPKTPSTAVSEAGQRGSWETEDTEHTNDSEENDEEEEDDIDLHMSATERPNRSSNFALIDLAPSHSKLNSNTKSPLTKLMKTNETTDESQGSSSLSQFKFHTVSGSSSFRMSNGDKGRFAQPSRSFALSDSSGSFLDVIPPSPKSSLTRSLRGPSDTSESPELKSSNGSSKLGSRKNTPFQISRTMKDSRSHTLTHYPTMLSKDSPSSKSKKAGSLTPQVGSSKAEAEVPVISESSHRELPVKSFTGRCKKGRTFGVPGKINQDRYLMQFDPDTNTALFAIMDGHGDLGHVISSYVEKNLAHMLFEHPSFDSDLSTAIYDTIVSLNKIIKKDPAIESFLSGTTLVCCAIRDEFIYVANVGDSRLIMASEYNKTLKAVPITEDHKLSLKEEKSRIKKHGGVIVSLDVGNGQVVYRVVQENSEVPGLAMSRSIGDDLAHTLGVTSMPKLYKHKISKNDKYIVLASDGIWEFISNKEVVNYLSLNDYIDDAIEELTAEAAKRWMQTAKSVDDISIIVVELRS